MRSIALNEAEKRLRTLVGEARTGARFSIIEDYVPQARLLPPDGGSVARSLDFVALKRHLSRCEALGRPRTWTRAALYRSGGP